MSKGNGSRIWTVTRIGVQGSANFSFRATSSSRLQESKSTTQNWGAVEGLFSASDILRNASYVFFGASTESRHISSALDYALVMQLNYLGSWAPVCFATITAGCPRTRVNPYVRRKARASGGVEHDEACLSLLCKRSAVVLKPYVRAGRAAIVPKLHLVKESRSSLSDPMANG